MLEEVVEVFKEGAGVIVRVSWERKSVGWGTRWGIMGTQPDGVLLLLVLDYTQNSIEALNLS